MLVKYYNNSELAYSNRKRYRNFSFIPFFTEEQKSILLGDGANTQIKTSKNNICNYVTIDDTRWFVTSYIYMNGGQVTLNLQRDVIGEFGVADCYGKIERGYTDNFLKNRKELKLNQILKDRKKLYPNFNRYGNYYVDTHNNEMWGVLYLVKPTEVDPLTGEPYPEQVNINIPAFAPDVVDLNYIEDGTKIYIDNDDTESISISFQVKLFQGANILNIPYPVSKGCFKVSLQLRQVNGSWVEDNVVITPLTEEYYDFEIHYYNTIDNEYNAAYILYKLGTYMIEALLNPLIPPYGIYELISFPVIPDITKDYTDYNDVTIKKDNDFYKYTTTKNKEYFYGSQASKKALFENWIKLVINSTKVDDVRTEVGYIDERLLYFNIDNKLTVTSLTYNVKKLTAAESGTFVIDISQQLVDEPYSIMVFPLYDVKITGSEEYQIDKSTAFTIFNSVIQCLSGGTNPYLVDAQIYPYCPTLSKASSIINGYPFFSIFSSCYEHYCNVNLYPSSDIKKEYIQRNYSIVSPDQSNKFTFNFYDYVTKIEDNNGTNFASMQIVVKTSLKPFAIISSAVIQPSLTSLIGMTYPSDMRGSQPSSNGFECSLASNAFETYKRENSNYQQIFGLQQDALDMQHITEKVNEDTSNTINILSATAFGAIAGKSIADVGFTGVAGATGAAIGAAAGTLSVGIASSIQSNQNEKLREFESYQQQQTFDLNIGTIKNLPNSISRISTFSEILLKDFAFIIETYECSDQEKNIVDSFIAKYGYGIGVFDYIANYQKDGWFLRSTLVSSSYAVNLHLIAEKELMGGIYLYEQI